MGYLPAYGEMGATSDAISAALKVTEDPHLSEVTCQVLRLSAIEEGRTPGPPCPRTPLNVSPGRGIGLRHAVVPIRVFVKAREKPILAAAFVAGVTLAVFGFGVAIGRQRRTVTP